jgi:GAF domain-containing protein
MPAALLPRHEAARLAALLELAVLDTPADRSYDRLVAQAARAMRVPTALVSFVDADRAWFKARIGMAAPEMAREMSFCAHAFHDDAPLVVNDAAEDQRFADNPLVTGAPGIRFYAGAPIRPQNGPAIGTLCVIDYRPRRLSAHELGVLCSLARSVSAQLDVRMTVDDAGGPAERFGLRVATRYAALRPSSTA